ncbi:ABC transporter permease [Aurantiacibacter xanthus]|uniref:ABC transporter permease n=1 Tax=Aurantiacibacter xanthus TaxID=1784712 RepID=A0A3A1NZR3_9SPHN|nr:ABC transporter permease [Aurantiacibacter xanthus]RIV81597.1 ABC transporter permease [Aurantiacibacter xanthus]
MNTFRAAFFRELTLIRSSRPLLAAVTILPALSLLLIAAMLSRGALGDLPIAIVDASHSPASRSLASDIVAQGGLVIAAAPATESEADALLRSGDIWAYAVIPETLGDTALGADPVRIDVNATYLSVGSIVERKMRRAVLGAFAQEVQDQVSRSGLAVDGDDLPGIQVNLLFNPQSSLEFYLEALIQPAILQLMAACVGVFVVVSEMREGSLARWVAETGGGIAAWAGKFLPYLAILSWWGAMWMIWLVGFREWRMEGSLLFAMLAQATLIAASLTLSGAIAALTRQSGIAFSASALYAGSALAYSGGSLPIEGSAAPVVWWSEALPFTHYLRIQMDQFLGSPIGVDLADLALLLAYFAAGLGLCLFATRDAA